MELLESIRALIKTLRHEKREQYHRHVSVGDLLTDRFEIARDYGFGDGTSCYDNVLILGDVTVGKDCWIVLSAQCHSSIGTSRAIQGCGEYPLHQDKTAYRPAISAHIPRFYVIAPTLY